MTSRHKISRTIMALWKARLAEDVDETIKDFAENGMFELNAKGIGVRRPTVGKAALRRELDTLFKTWGFKRWRKLDLLIDGEKALIRWSAKVICTPTKKTATFECYDLVKFRNGKIIEYRQTTDTAMMMSLATP